MSRVFFTKRDDKAGNQGRARVEVPIADNRIVFLNNIVHIQSDGKMGPPSSHMIVSPEDIADLS
jgi:hypothetical protein